MPLRGRAFLALWNDHSYPDYNFWHTREHVGERLGIPGILSSRRYVDGAGTLPAYFTLYELEDISVLESTPYRQLLSTPTLWSQAMRPGMSRFLRRGCQVIESVGAGIAGTLAVSLFPLGAAARDGDVLADIASGRAFSAAHLGFVDASTSGVPFSVAEAPADDGEAGVIMLECYDTKDPAHSVAAISDLLHSRGVSASLAEFSVYRLAFALNRDDRDRMLRFDRMEAG